MEQAAAEAIAALELPERDLTDVPFVTIDPAGSTDLDQAVHLERAGDGYRVLYAIADIPAFVEPGGPIDVEARKRGQTMYAPDGRIPLHPATISEDAASLLQDQVRGAYVWEFDLDAAAEVTAVRVERARIVNRRQTDYVTVQAELDAGKADEWLVLLKEVGLKRIELEAIRGGASLNRPDEEVRLVDDVYTLSRRMTLPVEDWNAQISLMTGMAAAQLMLEGGVGILRTMPAPDAERLERFRRQVAALGAPWPEDVAYGAYLRGLDPNDPKAPRGDPRGRRAVPRCRLHAVRRRAAGQQRAGSGRRAVRAHDRADPQTGRPLRAGDLRGAEPRPRRCRSGCAMRCPTCRTTWRRPTARRTSSSAQSLDAIEAALLSSRVGEEFDAIVIQTKEHGGVIQLTDPVVTAEMEGSARPGSRVLAELVQADIAKRKVLFRRSTT